MNLSTAWQFAILTRLQIQALSINLLQILGAIITIEMSILFDTHPSHSPHILAFTDSSSALGWLYHSQLLFKHQASLHSEHIAGEHNVVADSLSCNFHLSNSALTALFHSHTPTQVPPTFQLQALPKQISCWLVSVLELLMPQTGSLPAPRPSNLAILKSTPPSSKNVGSPISSSTVTPTSSTTSSFAPLYKASRENFHQSSTFKAHLKGDTVDATISHVVLAFRLNLQPEPTLDAAGA